MNTIDNKEYFKKINITITGKTKNEIESKEVKIKYLLNFLNNSKLEKLFILFFSIFIFLFGLYITTGIFIQIDGIYSYKYNSFVKNIEYFKKDMNGNINMNKVYITNVSNCDKKYCIINNGEIIEKPLINNYIILNFNN